jgi:hypothetical protein
MYGRNGGKHPLTAEWSCSTDAADFRILANSLLKVQWYTSCCIHQWTVIHALVHSLLSFLLLSVCLSVISLLPSKWSLEISTQNAKYHLELQSPAVSLRISHGPTKLANGCALILSLTLSPLTTKKTPKDFLTCWEWTTYVETSFAEWTDCEKKPEEETEYIRTQDLEDSKEDLAHVTGPPTLHSNSCSWPGFSF